MQRAKGFCEDLGFEILGELVDKTHIRERHSKNLFTVHSVKLIELFADEELRNENSDHDKS